MKKVNLSKKVAYLYFHASKNGSSVETKIFNQFNNINKHVLVDCYFFCFFDKVELKKIHAEIIYLFYRLNNFTYFKSTREYAEQIKIVNQWIFENYNNYDFFIIRQPKSCIQSFRLMRRFGKKIIIEVQSKNINEISANKKKNYFGLKPSMLLSWLEHYFMPYIKELILARPIIGNAFKIVTVTNELKQYVEKKLKPSDALNKVKYIGNGIEIPGSTNDIEIKVKTFDGSKLNVLLLMGANTEAYWVGLDIILDSLKHYLGNCYIKLFVCGINGKKIKGKNYEVNYLGYLNKLDLLQLYGEIHLGLGSMAMERAGLIEGSTLKVREYLINGIPCVYGHLDTDLEKMFEEKLVLKINPQDLSFDDIVRFANEYYESYHKNHLRLAKEVRKKLDIKNKMLELVEFIYQ